ncbi:putative bifunctional diguanylate cyclase/phosphodiesterase [Gilvimarinus sp. F26214L]|uniref:putative bifunctional diguanylate cyclase/phosphodiesterase n=1 Tax=Gilvimarinus sp. DZF01 TaxID=3461371 RepID=UPI00404662FF
MAKFSNRYEAAFHNSPSPYVLLHRDLTVADVNASHLALTGQEKEDIVGRFVFDAFPVDDEALEQQLLQSYRKVLTTGCEDRLRILRYPVREGRQGGQAHCLSVTNRPIFNHSNQITHVLNHITELTDVWGHSPGSFTPTRSEERKLHTLMEQAPGFVAVSRGADFAFELANKAFYQLIGHRDILGKPVREALPELEGQGVVELMEQVYRTGEAFVGRALNIRFRRTENGPLLERYIDIVFQPILEADHEVTGIFLQGHDVTDAHELSRQLSHQAAHDSLTGLYNRREFERRLHMALRALPPGGVHSVLYLDLDQFKLVNDTCGHHAGDEFLRLVSLVLTSRVRPADTLARLGGDEFGLLLEGCPEHTATRIAEELRESISDLEFIWQKRVFGGSVSIGLVAITDRDMGLSGALSAADSSCFLAKEKGRNRVQIYRVEDDELINRRQEMDAIGPLRRALKEDRFELYWQKILPLGERALVPAHYEVLLRLRRPDGELAPPQDFIPAAERYGLMPAIDRHVVRRVFVYLADRTKSPCSLSVNLSGATLNDETFALFIADLMAAYPIDTSRVCFELTETAAVANLTRTADLVGQLKTFGFQFALDDFGSGMSSFAYLKQLPVDYLKIDGVFVQRILEDRIDSAMVEAIARIAKVMGIRTVAEYVENEEICSLLARLGVDFGQGFAIHRPEPFC